MQLGQILIRKKWVSPPQLEEVIERQTQKRRKLGELMVDRGLIDEKQLEQALREQYWRRNGFWVID